MKSNGISFCFAMCSARCPNPPAHSLVNANFRTWHKWIEWMWMRDRSQQRRPLRRSREARVWAPDSGRIEQTPSHRCILWQKKRWLKDFRLPGIEAVRRSLPLGETFAMLTSCLYQKDESQRNIRGDYSSQFPDASAASDFTRHRGPLAFGPRVPRYAGSSNFVPPTSVRMG